MKSPRPVATKPAKTGAPQISASPMPFDALQPKHKPKDSSERPPLKRVPGMGKNVLYDAYSGRWVVYRWVS